MNRSRSSDSTNRSRSSPRRARAIALAILAVVSVVAVAPAATAHETVVAVDVSAEPSQPTAGDNATFAVTVDNIVADGEPAHVAEVTLYNGTDDDAEELDAKSPRERIGAGGEATWELESELDEAGERTFAVDVRLEPENAQTTTVTRTVDVTVVDPHPSVAVGTSPVGPSGTTDVDVTVAGPGGANLTGLELSLASPDTSFSEPRRVVSSLDPGTERTLSFTTGDVDPGETTFAVEGSYTDGQGTHRTFERTLTTTVEEVTNPARIELTGVRVDQEGDTLVVRGSASNPGGQNATGTIVRAVSGEDVAPGSSQSDFFVGDVEASDFRSFDVNGRLTGNTSGTVEIPLEIEYGVDGERVTRETTVRYDSASGQEQAPDAGGGGGGAPLGLIGLGLVGVLAVVGWRYYR